MAAFINTAFVLLFTWLGFTVMHTTFTGIPNNHLLGWLILSVAGVNGIVEIIVSAILVGVIATPIMSYLNRRHWSAMTVTKELVIHLDRQLLRLF